MLPDVRFAVIVKHRFQPDFSGPTGDPRKSPQNPLLRANLAANFLVIERAAADKGKMSSYEIRTDAGLPLRDAWSPAQRAPTWSP